MKFSGNPSQWRPLLDFIPHILSLVMAAWDKFEKPQPNEPEVPITRRFLLALRRERSQQGDIPFRIYSEVEVFDLEGPYGRTDIQFQPRYTSQEEVYFAIECKRLNVSYPSGFRSLADEYVGEDGMMCFVTGKYSKGHPAGGMIGYVMDGRVNKAIAAVEKAIAKARDLLCLHPGDCFSKCSLVPADKEGRQSQHGLSDGDLTLYHLFLGTT